MPRSAPPPDRAALEARLAANLRPSPRLPAAPPQRPVRARKRRGAVSPRAEASAGAAAPRSASAPLSVTVALRTVNALNRHGEHYQARATRVRRERTVVLAALRAQVGRVPPPLPPLGSGRKLLVVLTRVSPGRMDSDGAIASLKGTRDSVADYLGCDDADPRLAWAYEQDPGDAMAVRVTLHPDATPCDCRHGWRAP